MLNYIALIGFLLIMGYVVKRIMDKSDQYSQFIMHSKDEQAFHASFKKPFNHKEVARKRLAEEKDKDITNTWDSAYLAGEITNDQAKTLEMTIDE